MDRKEEEAREEEEAGELVRLREGGRGGSGSQQRRTSH